MKRILCALALIVLALCFASCSGGDPEAPDGMVTASNDKVDYNLYVPQDWTVETSTGVITAKFSDSITVNINMMAATLPQGIDSAQAYWEDYREKFASVYTDWELLSEEATLLDGYEAQQYVYTGAVGGSDALKFQQTVCVRGDVVYLFTYTADPAHYEEYVADVAQMLENFTFKD